MFIARLKSESPFVRRGLVRRGAFTLLEITLAVAILGLMAVAIYRFVATNLTAVRLSAEVSALDARYAGFETLLTGELQALPSGEGALTGEPYKFNGRSRDEMTWICPAGPGLFTRYATGEYEVTLRLRPIPRSNFMELGVARESTDEDAPAGQKNPAWVPLMEDVSAMEIRYFDPRLNGWVDRWTDQSTLPHLVRISINRANTAAPWQAVIAIRPTPL
ncbi:MAG TPA: type II secretion system protein GspJ [Chthoniobacterales bacterium]|jgi:prepilin-type N-terminal cleavage/methylation domain-containing protein